MYDWIIVYMDGTAERIFADDIIDAVIHADYKNIRSVTRLHVD